MVVCLIERALVYGWVLTCVFDLVIMLGLNSYCVTAYGICLYDGFLGFMFWVCFACLLTDVLGFGLEFVGLFAVYAYLFWVLLILGICDCCVLCYCVLICWFEVEGWVIV